MRCHERIMNQIFSGALMWTGATVPTVICWIWFLCCYHFHCSFFVLWNISKYRLLIFFSFLFPVFFGSPPLTHKHPNSFIHIVPVLCSLVQASLITWKQSLMSRKYVLCLWRAEKRHLMNTAIIAMRGRCIFVLQRLLHLFWKVDISTKAGMTSSGIIRAFHRLSIWFWNGSVGDS